MDVALTTNWRDWPGLHKLSDPGRFMQNTVLPMVREPDLHSTSSSKSADDQLSELDILEIESLQS